jgi:cell division protein FtsL
MAKIINFSQGNGQSPEGGTPQADTTQQARAARKEKAQAKNRAKALLGRFLAALVTVVIILLAVTAVIFRDQLNIDSIRRYLAYQSLERDETGQAEEIFFDNNSTNCFVQVDNSLLVCSSNGIRLFSQSGTEYISETVALNNPAAQAEGSYAVAFDLGGTSLYQISGKTLTDTKKTDGPIFNARVNSNGYLTVITQETGYKGVVTVYDAKGNTRMKVNISSAYVMDAGISLDGSTLALATIGEVGGSFASTVTFYDGATGDVQESYPLSGQLVTDLQWKDNQLWVQTDEGCAVLQADQGVVGDWISSDGYLWGYAFRDGSTHASVWGKYESGNQGTVVVVDENGSVTGEIPLTQRILSFSAAGDYLAVLYTNQLEIYDGNLNLYASLEDTAGARQVLMRSDGSALLVGVESASLYVP